MIISLWDALTHLRCVPWYPIDWKRSKICNESMNVQCKVSLNQSTWTGPSKMVVFLCFGFQPSLETMSKTGGRHSWHRRQRWHGGGGGRGWSRSGRGRLSLGKCMKKSVMMIDSLSCGKIIPGFFWGGVFVNGETWRYLIFGILLSSRLGASGFPSREPSNNLFLFPF